MRYIAGDPPCVELSHRNLRTLLDKLDDPLSVRMLRDPEQMITVHAVANSDEEQYVDGVLDISRLSLLSLLALLTSENPIPMMRLAGGTIIVRAANDAEHYKTRPPGPVFMPSSGEVR